jgi:uncharacterized surface protein with fasciclin (FAS1) repeats
MCDVLLLAPTKFSTFITAVNRVGLQKEFHECKAWTAFVPPNNAWENLGFKNLMFLFSEHGVKELKKIVEFHLAQELVYADELLEKKEMRLKTLNKQEELEIKAVSLKEKRSRRYGESGERGECPSEFTFVINRGEATITVFIITLTISTLMPSLRTGT